MEPPFLPYGRQVVDDDDIAAVVEVLKGDWLTTGPTVEAFERAVADRVGATHAVACSSGTAALHMAAIGLELGPGDVVVVPSVTFLATANAARYVGADVAFADINPETGLTDVAAVADAVRRGAERGTVRAIFPVHLAGHCVDVASIWEAFPDLALVEDACHALGGDVVTDGGDGVPVGACRWSDAAMFSTHPVKTIATGEGGVLTTNDATLASRFARARNHGMVREPSAFRNRDLAFEAGGNEPAPWYYEMHQPGYNYRLSDILCALGLSQIAKLDRFVDRRRALRDRYAARFADVFADRRDVVRMAPVAPNCRPAWHLAVALIDFQALGTTRTAVMTALRTRGVGTQVHYVPVHRQPYYVDRYGALDLPGADAYYAKCLSLPLFPSMTEGDVDRVVEAIASVLPA